MLKIYGYAASINVRKVLWTCEELGLEFEREDGGGALNPVGLVPVIDDAGTLIWESNVIVRYLATRHGRTDLLPADPSQRAHVEQWMDWQASDFNNSWRVAFQALVRKNPEFQDPVAIGKSRGRYRSTSIATTRACSNAADSVFMEGTAVPDAQTLRNVRRCTAGHARS